MLVSVLESFQERLKMTRESKGMTQSQLCDASGVSQAQLSLYESGQRSPTADTLMKLAKSLNVSVDYLLGLVDSPLSNLRGEVTSANLKTQKQIPILGQVSAGSGVPAEDDVIGHMMIDETESIDFALVVHGHSMYPKLLDGDIVFVRKQQLARNGQMVVVRINGDEGVIKYFHKSGDTIILTSENPDYKPIRINRDRWTTECAIIGVVVGLKRKLSDF
jgi:repressor LexA